MPNKTYGANTVTAAEISRNFGEWQSRALTNPVIITHHGRGRLILMSLEEFEGLETSRVDRPNEGAPRSTAQLRSVLAQIHEGFIALDQNLRLTDANPVAELYLGFAKEDLLGQDLRELIPSCRSAIHWDYYKRALRTGEAIDFTARSPTHDGVVMAIRAFPYEAGVGVMFTNITVTEEAILDQRWWQAFQGAVRVDPSLAIIRLNVRGGLTRVDDNFCAMTGFGPEQLESLLLTEICHPHERLALARTINDVLRERTAKITTVAVMTRNGEDRRLKFAMSPGADEPAADGLIVCVTDLGAQASEDWQKAG